MEASTPMTGKTPKRLWTRKWTVAALLGLWLVGLAVGLGQEPSALERYRLKVISAKANTETKSGTVSLQSCPTSSISCPVNISAMMVQSACGVLGSNGDYYSFDGVVGQTVTIDMVSTAFEVDLMMLTPYGGVATSNVLSFLALNGVSHDQIIFTLPSPGTYIIQAESLWSPPSPYPATGPYTLSVTGCTGSQPSSTGFSGKVTDVATGAGISGASVTWGSSSTTTDGSGSYNLNSLPCQTNTLTVSKSGYQTSSQSYTPTCNTTSNVKNVPLTASQAQQVTFNFVGAPQTWAVPPGVTSVAVDARGAQGGGNGPTIPGGKGGRLQTSLAVTPGETLVIYVGGKGGDSNFSGPNTGGPGGFNGGGAGGIDKVDFNSPAGGGGGASDVRQGDGLANRVVVAGGGGGSECCGISQANPSPEGPGGDGGGLTGKSGGTSGGGSAPGGGGTQSSGGAGGGGCINGNGSSGSLGQGGVGGSGYRAGGGGGGGYYGGGGGGTCFLGSGGGGGSSYSAGTSTIHTQGYQTGTGQVVIAYSGPPGPVVPAVPTNLLAVALSASTISLAWTDNSGNETGFKIERKTGIAGTYTQIGIQAQNLNFFSDSGLTASTQYCYRVRATNTAGDSAYSNESCATTQAAPASPPGSFTLTANAYCNTTPPGAPAVALSWTPSSGVSSYSVYRDRAAYASGITQTSFANTANVAAGQTYTYFIRAANTAGNTDSNTLTVTVPSNVCASCSLTCTATVPSTTLAGASVAFQATATPASCTGSPTYDWDFGDGSPHSTQQNPTHKYASLGSFTWRMVVTAAGHTCSETGTITAQPPVVFVHGFCSDARTWDAMIPTLQDLNPKRYGTERVDLYYDGSTVRTLEAGSVSPAGIYTITFYNPLVLGFEKNSVAQLPIEAEAYQLGRVVQAIRAVNGDVPVVDIVTHSIGGLVARSYVEGLASNGLAQDLPFRGDVRRVVTIDAPHAGAEFTEIAIRNFPNCVVEASRQKEESAPASPFLQSLNGLPIPTPANGSFELLTAIVSHLQGEGDDGLVTVQSQNITVTPQYSCEISRDTDFIDSSVGWNPLFPPPFLHTKVQDLEQTARWVNSRIGAKSVRRLSCQALAPGVPTVIAPDATAGAFAYRIDLAFSNSTSGVGAETSQSLKGELVCTVDVVARSDSGAELARRTVAAEGFQSVSLGILPGSGWHLEVIAGCKVMVSVSLMALPPCGDGERCSRVVLFR